MRCVVLDPLLDSLTAVQREAVQHMDGPLLILAGPGSGKTRVVTHRIAHLLHRGVPAREILALTFTNKAADEMRGRLETLAPHQPVWVSTFHRFGSRLLRTYAPLVGLESSFTIYDADDSRQVLRRVLKEMPETDAHARPQRIGEAIRRFKNNLIPAHACQPRGNDPIEHIAADVYPHYQARLLASSAVDFDDLLLHMAILLTENAELRATLDERFRYILVDEYQDTNLAQYVILRALSCLHPNLAVTGDPDQAIYGWRGANVGNILRFETDFPDVRVVRLEQNWRSTKRILRVADQLISYNTRRRPKRLTTDNCEGPPVRLVAYPTQTEEAADIAGQIAEQLEHSGRRAGDFAVFYRLNALSRTLETALSNRGVPYQLVHGLEFYQRKEIKDLLAYAMLVCNPRDDVAFVRIVNVPPRGIGQRTIERLRQHAARHGLALLDVARKSGQVPALAKRSATQVARFAALIDRIAVLAAEPVETLLERIIAETGYRELYEGSDLEVDMNRVANMEELRTAAHQFDRMHPDEGGLEEFLARAALVSDTDDWDGPSDKVTLMTLHAAKGLEFPVVFIVAVEEGVLPHERSLRDLDRLEEERRLMFVGLTRAMEQLQVSYSVHREFRDREGRTIPSGFLMELPRHEMEMAGGSLTGSAPDVPAHERTPAPTAVPGSQTTVMTTAARMAGEVPDRGSDVSPAEFLTGMAVTHPDYGPGKVVGLDGHGTHRRATVSFPMAGQKAFVLANSPLRPARRVQE